MNVWIAKCTWPREHGYERTEVRVFDMQPSTEDLADVLCLGQPMLEPGTLSNHWKGPRGMRVVVYQTMLHKVPGAIEAETDRLRKALQEALYFIRACQAAARMQIEEEQYQSVLRRLGEVCRG